VILSGIWMEDRKCLTFDMSGAKGVQRPWDVHLMQGLETAALLFENERHALRGRRPVL
jgi:hypothetical protein